MRCYLNNKKQENLELKKATEKLNDKRDFSIAVFFMLLSGLGFALMNLFSRLLIDIAPVQKTFYRNVIVFIISALILAHSAKKEPRKLYKDRSDLTWLIIRSIFGTIGILANFYTVDHMPIAIASVINKLSPFFTIIFAAIFLKEAINKVQAMGIIMAFIGVVVLVRPGSETSLLTLTPVFIGVVGALFAGAAYTSIRYLSKRSVDGQFIVVFFAGFAALSLLPWMLLNGVSMNLKQSFYMLLVGLAGLLGQYGITFAYKYASANQVSIYDYSNVAFTTIFGIIFLDQIPMKLDFLGILIIFSASLLMFLYNRRQGNGK